MNHYDMFNFMKDNLNEEMAIIMVEKLCYYYDTWDDEYFRFVLKSFNKF